MSVLTAAGRPSFREALLVWWKLGWISFGGTAAHIALMHDELVEKRTWIGNEAFLHALSHCMILPGPEATQLAIYIGLKLHGKKGGLAAGTLFVLPSIFVLLGLSLIYVRFGRLPWIAAMFAGLKPAVIALIILALSRVAKRAVHSALQWAIATAAFTGMFFFNVSLPLIMLAVVVLVILAALRPQLLGSYGETEWDKEGTINSIQDDLPEHEQRPLRITVMKLAGITCLIWLAPLCCLHFFGNDFLFWKTLALFFTKAAFVTVGGSYTVIPYVAQVAVGKLHWLSSVQMTDGFALAETTPGPLIIVVAFVGFMAAHNHFDKSLWMGTLGLLLTTFYTFLPCFLFVFAGAPIVEHTHRKPAVKGILSLITAVVVGAMLDLTLFLGKGVLFLAGTVTLPNFDKISAGWVLISLLLLQRFKMNVVYVILCSIAFCALSHRLGVLQH